ncbi:Cobalt-precorrin-6A synthase (deacetylating) [Candidatus Glomeribacter gigasporarum BEG34]|uniref:Cobalt-precorrin-5B C(1)-methyltransferase n=1 Tax=Candidatus Glomeribacter gigasporarum BEG34 TaxID=1070319 RepID=G2JAK6_9BURK|nr:cobalt-precorrin-5B (C(1))-methyltransferase CbiD [Candidatus Glomeribacter gigasporarum]CCD29808.1 Cobalt-precorrin-6A synthase (deacetylating) [Candidatus Glomeribacter gigasporarum BEG34]
MNARRCYDLAALAPNGLRRGYTTGTCAAAAVKAALGLLLRGLREPSVAVSLPDSDYFLTVPVQSVHWSAPGTAHAEVVKDGGDDPDNTHGATLFASVSINARRALRFFAGQGVGTVTKPGLRVAVGEPAINPMPRQMIRQAIDEMLQESRMAALARRAFAASTLVRQGGTTPPARPCETPGHADPGFDVFIGCIGGETIARKTFNPRLGVVGGLSILGTTGIVEPMSLAAWMASIEVYIRVALSDRAPAIALMPGKIGREYARSVLGLPDARSVQIANFVGPSLEFVQRTLVEAGRHLETLWLLSHPGKLVKVLNGYWDTHSSKSVMAMSAVARVAVECGISRARVRHIEQANTMEEVVTILSDDQLPARQLWCEVERRIAALIRERAPRADRVEVRLFDMQGLPLGAAA